MKISLLVLLAMGWTVALPVRAASTGFTYQGRLSDGGAPANGTYDMQFVLFDAPSNGLSFGTNGPLSVDAASGLFTVALDFGAGVFDGGDRWLEIDVRTNGSADAFMILSPRTQLTSTPYATRAASAAEFTGAVADSQLSGNVAKLDAAAQAFTGTMRITNAANRFGGDGAALTGLDAANIEAGTMADARLTTNVALLNRNPQVFTGTNIFTSSVGIGTASPRAKLTIAGPNGTAVQVIGPGGGGATVSLDLSTYNSGSNAPSSRLLATDVNWSSSLDFQTKIPGANANALVSRLFITPDGKVGVGTNSPATKLHVNGDLTCIAVNLTSDRNAKKDFEPVTPLEVLEKVLRLPISEWAYKADPSARHIGPMAQDFRAEFGLGRDDKHITSVDADGVALAAIQGLHQIVREREAEVTHLKEQNQTLAERLAAIERAVGLSTPEQVKNGGAQ